MEREHLNENNYQKVEKGLIIIAIIIILCGILGGGYLIKKGIDKMSSAGQENTAVSKTARLAVLNTELNAITSKISELETEIKKLVREKTKVFSEGSGFSDKYYEY